MALRKVEFSFFFTCFWNLWCFTKTTIPNLSFQFHSKGRVVTKSPAQAVTPNFLCIKCFGPRKSRIFDFFDLFLKFLVFTENNSPKSEFSVSIQRTDCEIFSCVSCDAQFFCIKSFGPRKSRILDFFLPAFEFFGFFRKLPS